MNAARLNGPHSAGKPEDELLQRSIQPLLERGLDSTLEADLFGKIRRDIEDRLNLAARLVQDGKDHPQCFGERGGGIFIFCRESRQAAVPHQSALAPEPPYADRYQENRRKYQNQESNSDDHRRYRATGTHACGEYQPMTGHQMGADSLSEQLLSHRVKYWEKPSRTQAQGGA